MIFSSLYLAGVVAKYCNEHVCVGLFVCLSVCSPAYLPNHTRDLYQFLCMLPIAVARSSSGGLTKSQRDGALLKVFFSTDNALYSRAFGTHTKTAKSIEMPFG